MSEVGAAPANGVWRWIAAILIAIMLAGAPSIVQAIKAPSQEEVDVIHERQVQMLIRLSIIESQLRELRLQLQAHSR